MKLKKISVFTFYLFFITCLTFFIYKKFKHNPQSIDIYIINNSSTDYEISKDKYFKKLAANDTIFIKSISLQNEVPDIKTLLCSGKIPANSIKTKQGVEIEKDYKLEENWKKFYKNERKLDCVFTIKPVHQIKNFRKSK